ncbi:restriction endonuclease [Lottiidibacillus patelloidae]|uniref:Restriction endonuclease n=1 Tax=Lottiidibacillus patelloidae TaxID=2670334 RepID=A0A263BRJ7_9BACI|nr:restriction endonuclease [Lottiidibacillus patelloidae]OZM56329.1 restriction endonuclease [Lottiidibacillus patelloidae]
MTSSNDPSRVPIKNIYYMLAYAWDHPHEKNFITVYEDDEKDLINLLSKVLLMKIKALIKKGFYKKYIEYQEESGIIRGKILFKESIQTFSHKRAKMFIQQENMTYDILHNQLIKSTFYFLTKHKELEKKYQDEIKSVLSYFHGISLIKVNIRMFKEINLHRNNQHYQFLLNICQFIWENSLLNEGESQKIFLDFNREHHLMARLFENFVKNFYRKEINGSKVKSESINWPAEGNKTNYLPNMKTDISLEISNQKIIMDTKFYKKTLGEYWDKETVHSAHLYQLFSYIKNDEFYSGRKSKGILLYPRVDKSINLNYKIHGFDIKICTLDLTRNWAKIHEQLLEIVSDKSL